MSDVPPEIISDIFSRLPVKSLLRFRCVSKPVCDLIDSPNFIKSHLHHSLNSNSHRILLTTYGGLYSIDFNSLDKAILLKPPTNTPEYVTQFLGHCNGLLCLECILSNEIFVWNPSTREHKKLPFAQVEYPDYPCGTVMFKKTAYGFGYDHFNDDYKVVRAIQFYNEVENNIKVYSLKSDSWRRIKDFPYFLCYNETHGVYVNGSLHWVVSLHSHLEDPTRLIASFNLATEEYHLVPQPDYLDTDFHMNVGELGGKLTVYGYYNLISMDIWLMNSYGVGESWTKLLSVTQNVYPSTFGYMKPITYSKDGEKVLIFQDVGKLFWYDWKLKILKDIKIPDVPQFWEVNVYVESLVKLPEGCKN